MMSLNGSYRNHATIAAPPTAQRQMMMRWRSSVRWSTTDMVPARSSGLFREGISFMGAGRPGQPAADGSVGLSDPATSVAGGVVGSVGAGRAARWTPGAVGDGAGRL